MRIYEKLRWQWFTLYYGVRNIRLFWRAVWRFETCSEHSLLELIELATGEMAKHHREHGVTMDREKVGTQLATTSQLCRRLQDNKYFQRAGYDRKTWHTIPDFEQVRIVEHSHYMQRQDVDHLSKMFHHINSWWD